MRYVKFDEVPYDMTPVRMDGAIYLCLPKHYKLKENPIPFMMLWVEVEFPVTFHKEDMVVIVSSNFREENFAVNKFSQDYIIKQKDSFTCSL